MSMHFSPTAIALGSSAIVKVSGHFSPTAIALGPSAIVKVSGQNCFWTLHGSLGQIRLGLPKGVSPRFHQVSSSFVVSLVLWGRSVLGC